MQRAQKDASLDNFPLPEALSRKRKAENAQVKPFLESCFYVSAVEINLLCSASQPGSPGSLFDPASKVQRVAKKKGIV